MHLPDEGELLRERVQQQIRLGVIEDFLPHVRQAKSQVVHGGYEISRIAARRHRGGEQLSRHARRASFVFPSKRSFKAFHAATPSPKQATSVL